MRLPSKTSHRETVARFSATMLLGLVLLLCGPLAAAQNTLGELLDAGARKLSAAEFKDELVQRLIVGPTESGGSVEVVYTTRGLVQGAGVSRPPSSRSLVLSGTWNIGDQDTVCVTLHISTIASQVKEGLPSRCQFWFKSGGEYFLADSDWDRSSVVLRRTVKR
jgi:hypothetical protein